MSQYEAELRLELERLFFLINYHTEKKDFIWDNEKEYQEYIDAALDRVNEIKIELHLIQRDDYLSE
jgi:ribosome assembly protein YihI (activator of Der GTPase)